MESNNDAEYVQYLIDLLQSEDNKLEDIFKIIEKNKRLQEICLKIEKNKKLEEIPPTLYQTSLKRLFTEGLPDMKKEQNTAAYISLNHSEAITIINFEKNFPQGIHHNYQDGTSILLTDYVRHGIRSSSEANVRLNVRYLFSDMIAAGGFSGLIRLSNDLAIIESSPDLLVIQTSDNSPIGVIVIRKPTDGILDDNIVVGQLFDSLLKFHCFHGRNRVLGILTTYEEWKIYELDFNKINERTMDSTHIYHHNNPETLHVLMSTLSMMIDTRRCQLPLISSSRPYLYVTKDEIFQWKYLPRPIPKLSFQIPQFDSFTGLYVICDYHSGGDGRVWLGCSDTGNIAVVKFLHKENYHTNSYSIQQVESEVNNWNQLFGEKTAYTKILYGVPAIVMPFVFHCKYIENTWQFTNSLSKDNLNSDSIDDDDETSIFIEDVSILLDQFQDIYETARQAIELFAQRNFIHEDLELRHLGLLPVFEQQTLYKLVPTFIDLSRLVLVSDTGSDHCQTIMISKFHNLLERKERK